MDQSDFSPQHMRNVDAASPTHRSSSLYPSYRHTDPRGISPFTTTHQATMAPGQGPQQPINEITPIVSNRDSAQRRYSSTENITRDRRSNAESVKSQSQQGPDRRNSATGSEGHQASWYTRIADRYGSIELENKGSVARDHLALERTFLAWLRTSLAFASIGIAVTQLFRLSSTTTSSTDGVEVSSHSVPAFLMPTYSDSQTVRINSSSQRLRSIGKPLGTTFIGVAVLILLVGFHRYFESQYWIIRGKFPASRGSIALIAGVAGALIVTALAVIIAISPGAVES